MPRFRVTGVLLIGLTGGIGSGKSTVSALLAEKGAVIIDADLRNAERLIFHPNVNTASLTISFRDLERFLASRPNTVRYVRI